MRIELVSLMVRRGAGFLSLGSTFSSSIPRLSHPPPRVPLRPPLPPIPTPALPYLHAITPYPTSPPSALSPPPPHHQPVHLTLPFELGVRGPSQQILKLIKTVQLSRLSSDKLHYITLRISTPLYNDTSTSDRSFGYRWSGATGC